MRDEGDDAHGPAAQRACQREHLVDGGNQNRPQVVRPCALGWHGLGRGRDGVALWRNSSRALASDVWARVIAQQPLQGGAVVRLDAHTGIDREAAVLVGQHLLGIKALDQVEF